VEQDTNGGVDETVEPLNSSIVGNHAIHSINIQQYLAESCTTQNHIQNVVYTEQQNE